MKKELPPGFILQVLEKKGIKYKKSGSSFRLRCPFHDDKNPSASVDPEKSTFLCFVFQVFFKCFFIMILRISVYCFFACFKFLFLYFKQDDFLRL
ncbi:CHC2 zinc finger domain-containing protein [Persephonella sp. IF05-L8]|uniref:CHC2 zinc finger domain-containing protein n=1 Tax=Persephonella sp. IF05-L8 TaxID=1158338 RepID=UPI0009DED966